MNWANKYQQEILFAEKNVIMDCLYATMRPNGKFHYGNAAKALGKDRKWLWYKINQHKIHKP